MRVLVTGSSGHLGEALVRTLKAMSVEVRGIDVVPSPFTEFVGSIIDQEFVKQSVQGIDAILHTATLHKPHVATHSRQSFVDTNITGTLNLLEEAVLAGVRSLIFTSTTSTFGDALIPSVEAPAAWITEDVTPIPKNIYGVTKNAAEALCELFYRNHGLPCLVLRTSRFFPEADDRQKIREAYQDSNIKANELLYRRVDLEDVISAHLLALEKAPTIGFDRLIISANTPFTPDDLFDLRANAPAVVRQKFPDYEEIYTRHNWRMFPSIERVYVNERARNKLNWYPRYDFQHVLNSLNAGIDPRSPLAQVVGVKGYHAQTFVGEPYPME